MLSLEDYNNLMATMEINDNPVLKRRIEEGLNISLDECLSADEVAWCNIRSCILSR